MSGKETMAEDGDSQDERDSTMTTIQLGETDDVDDSADDDSVEAPTADGDTAVDDGDAEAKAPKRRLDWSRAFAYGLLPALALAIFAGAGYLKWRDDTNRDEQAARTQSVQAASDATVAMLSYTPADVDQKLVAARNLLTGDFRNEYTSLTNDVVIPGAKQQQITAIASVPAASSVSATVDHAVALVFVNQTTTIGTGAPTDLASTVRVVLDKHDGRWLVSKFDPV